MAEVDTAAPAETVAVAVAVADQNREDDGHDNVDGSAPEAQPDASEEATPTDTTAAPVDEAEPDAPATEDTGAEPETSAVSEAEVSKQEAENMDASADVAASEEQSTSAAVDTAPEDELAPERSEDKPVSADTAPEADADADANDDAADQTMQDAQADPSAEEPAPDASNNLDMETNAVLANVFGFDDDDDDEDEEFEGFEQSEISQLLPEPEPEEAPKEKSKTYRRNPRPVAPITASDDSPWAKLKRPKRRAQDGDDTMKDEVVKTVLTRMTVAAEEDIKAVYAHRPAVYKLRYLESAKSYIQHASYRLTFFENAAYKQYALWLKPLPDRSLPPEPVRNAMYSALEHMPPFDKQDKESFEESKLGRLCNFLRQHPKETIENKQRLTRLIEAWTRQLTGTHNKFDQLPEEEKRAIVLHQARMARRASSGGNSKASEAPAVDTSRLRPGEKGFIARARMPQPQTRTYIKRPEHKVARPIDPNVKETVSATGFDKMAMSFKKLQQSSRRGGTGASVNISGSFSGSMK
ncbi:uncharacterized protein MONBRDRAFT_9074 [Monosiga brevicollis MX1]|uniref:TFIIS N-terminal domain-containing protein n=1 Tax=Monosiga brevicollis TaxID=81824 RepID=A9V204_MONBE|nr:uncharacterized protein MONBRDRAFT_9074 [Monosiga brevicollis MX1]EDQ88657.1 predicted protein [Monosiga brevicollis MX1]|eukprot:XP_001746761.1 hypothetical protein [Monosiga brevicollis MX1]